jgi:hypothetical protein
VSEPGIDPRFDTRTEGARLADEFMTAIRWDDRLTRQVRAIAQDVIDNGLPAAEGGARVRRLIRTRSAHDAVFAEQMGTLGINLARIDWTHAFARFRQPPRRADQIT